MRMASYSESALRVAVACGGTGGHIFPGLATAEALRERGHDVTLWLAGRDVESLSVSDWEGAVQRVKASGFPSGISWASFKTAVGLCGAVWRCWRLMGQSRPQVCLAMGSYASVGPVLAARLRGIPVVLHEANVVPGRAISFLSRWAKVVALGFREAERYFPGCETRFSGLPLRQSILKGVGEAPSAPEWFPAYDPSCFTLLVMGGSQGAHVLNTVVADAVMALIEQGVSFQVVHLSGRADAEDVRQRYAQSGVRGIIHGFLSNMPGTYQLADLAVCRSGAASCAELAVYQVPAVFVPLPSARRDHQTANAEASCEDGRSTLMVQNELSAEAIGGVIRERVEQGQRQRAGAVSIHAEAAARLAALVEQSCIVD